MLHLILFCFVFCFCVVVVVFHYRMRSKSPMLIQWVHLWDTFQLILACLKIKRVWEFHWVNRIKILFEFVKKFRHSVSFNSHSLFWSFLQPATVVFSARSFVRLNSKNQSPAILVFKNAPKSAGSPVSCVNMWCHTGAFEFRMLCALFYNT